MQLFAWNWTSFCHEMLRQMPTDHTNLCAIFGHSLHSLVAAIDPVDDPVNRVKRQRPDTAHHLDGQDNVGGGVVCPFPHQDTTDAAILTEQ